MLKDLQKQGPKSEIEDRKILPERAKIPTKYGQELGSLMRNVEKVVLCVLGGLGPSLSR